MAGRSAPFVPMETDLRKEEKVAFTADFCGYNMFEALGRYFAMWAWCSDRGLEDAPDDCERYAVPDKVIERFLGPRGVDGILGDGCDALAMGIRRPDGLIELRGTSRTVARLRSARAGAPAGGRISADNADKNGRGAGGKFVSKATNVQPTASRPPADRQRETSDIPDPRSQIPDQESGDLTPARDPTATIGLPTREERHVARETMRKEINAARARVGEKLGTRLSPCPMFDRGIDEDLSHRLALATSKPALETLVEQAKHAVSMAELEAIADPKRVQFLTGAIFSGGNFTRLASQTPAGIAAVEPRQRAGPKSSAARAPVDFRSGAIQPSDPSCYPEEVEIP